MLSQKILNAIKITKNKILQPSIFQLSTLTDETLKRDREDAIKRHRKNMQKYEEHQEDEKTLRKDWHFERCGDESAKINKKPTVSMFDIFKMNIKLTPWGLSELYKETKQKNKMLSQKFNPMRNKTLGNDLALAHFLIYEGGKVKFKGIDEWITLNKDGMTVNLPNIYDPNFILTEIDASDTELYYHALENFENVSRIKRASFARCLLFDDWYVDRIVSIFPQLEYLDISECPKVTERGLEAIYKISNLKTLIVTNHLKSASFELTCMLLEDCTPGLEIQILDPKENNEPTDKK